MTPQGEKTRRRILRAAREAFSAWGLHGARMDEIARRAGVNKERIYAHVGNKDALFRAVLEQLFEEISAADEPLLKLTEDDLDSLAHMILRSNMAHHDHAPYFWRLLAWENLDGGKHSEVLPPFRKRGYEHLRKLYRRGQDKGVFRPDVSFETFILVLTASTFFYHSNQHTMSRSLQRDMSSSRARNRYIREVGNLLGPADHSGR